MKPLPGPRLPFSTLKQQLLEWFPSGPVGSCSPWCPFVSQGKDGINNYNQHAQRMGIAEQGTMLTTALLHFLE